MSEVGESEAERQPKLCDLIGSEEVDSDSGFNKRDWTIWSKYSEWKAKPDESREPSEVEEWQTSFQEESGFDKNHINAVVKLGLYSGQRNSVNKREGNGHTIYCNGDEYIGTYTDGKRNGSGLYRYKSLGCNPVDSKVDELWTLYKKEQSDAGSSWAKPSQEFLRATALKLKITVDMVALTIEKGPWPFFEGQWTANKKHGAHGVMRYRDGSVFIGAWHDDARHGSHGIYRYSQGDTYEGDYEHGLKHGEGVYKFTGQRAEYCGMWNKGLFTEGAWRMPDGTTFKGAFSQNRPNDQASLNEFPALGVLQHGAFTHGQWTPDNALVLRPQGTAPELTV